jgi:hypothetical protein
MGKGTGVTSAEQYELGQTLTLTYGGAPGMGMVQSVDPVLFVVMTRWPEVAYGVPFGDVEVTEQETPPSTGTDPDALELAPEQETTEQETTEP